MYIIFLLTVPSSFICAMVQSTMGVIHWSDYTLRGWLSFICFMHFGTAVRSFYDKEFLWMKIFTTEIAKDSVFQHLYGVWSILHALIFLQAAIYLYVIPIVRLVIWSLMISIGFFIVEAITGSVYVYGSSLFPFVMSAITLTWVVFFHYIWKPWKRKDLETENDMLLKGIPVQKYHKRKKHH